MFNPLANSETNLGRAGLSLVLTVLGMAPLSLALGAISADPAWTMLAAAITFPFIAWFMSRAAQAQGRNPWLNGLASLVPPLAILVFVTLYNRDVDIRLSRSSKARHDA